MIDLAAAEFDYWQAQVARVDLPRLVDRSEQARPRWMRSGACRGSGHDAYFPARGVPAALRQGRLRAL